ncbi:MAG: 3-deoxy-manno-octulosonate cytidylyltransferase family protein [Legionella sp.]
MKTVIVIPARYGSSRLPGKPLLMLGGQTMLERVVNLSRVAADGLPNVTILVATEDDRIAEHCRQLGVDYMMTSDHHLTGTDRVAEVVKRLPEQPDFVLNMQGDAPLTPPQCLRAMITTFQKTGCDVITPVTQLTWQQLDSLRQTKSSTPFSGTTVTFNPMTGKAFWFSKTIIPAIRQETEQRKTQQKSPVFRHIGLYGYSSAVLEQYVHLPEGQFERLEGLEQLRFLENNYTIHCVVVELNQHANMSGIDSPEDVVRAEALIAKQGELLTKVI